jgi:hypothetical protein
VSPDAPVPYYPAYLPAARQVPAVPYRLAPLAEAVLADPEAEADYWNSAGYDAEAAEYDVEPEAGL